jgi:hypothetical protein
VLDLTLIIPATACYQRNYVERYSRFIRKVDVHAPTPYPLPAGSGLLQDLGFLAFTLPQVEILMPTKKPRGQELTWEQQLAN